MKNKFIILCMSLLFLNACSKDQKQEETPAPVETNQKKLEIKIKDGFTGEHGEELLQPRSLKNILVDDYIPYTLTITDEDAKNGDKYALFAIKEGDKNHQTLQIDYEFYTEDDKGNKIKAEQSKIPFDKVGKHKFYIKPLVPGTFQLSFLFQKEGVGEIKPPKVNFNAVKITAWVSVRGVFPFVRSYFFKIEDGTNETDVYLEPQNATQTFETHYNGHHTIAPFEQGRLYEFHPEQKGFRKVPIPAPTLTITIVQKREGEEENRITYHNIPLNI